MLERLSIGAADAAATLVDASTLVSGAVVLATCNRFEAYLEIDAPSPATTAVALEETLAVLSTASAVPVATLRESIAVLLGNQVAEHLFAVSSGLKSVIIGEDEIAGQVRRALERARTSGTTSSGLERLFQNASRTSRGVKTQTAIGGAGRSLVRLALELASSRVTDWAKARVLIVGTGQYAGTTVAALRDLGAEDLRVYSPSGRAAKFALRYSITFEGTLVDAVAEADVVVTCTAALVITPDAIVGTARRLIIDLGLPRNVDPAVAAVDGVELLDLETVNLHAPLEELNATTQARSLVDQAAAEFAASSAEQSLAPAIVALRSHVFHLLDDEIERARVRGDADGRVEAALRHLAGVLLHTPSTRARELARDGGQQAFVDGLDALFGIRSSMTDAPVVSDDAAATAS